MSHPGEGKRGKCQPATCLFLTYAIYMRSSLWDPPAGATAAAALGGSKLKGREWSSPIPHKSLPRERTERPSPSAGEPTAHRLAAQSRFQRSRAVLASRSAAFPSPPPLALGTSLFFFISTSLHRGLHLVVFFWGGEGVLLLLFCPLSGPQIPPCGPRVSKEHRLLQKLHLKISPSLGFLFLPALCTFFLQPPGALPTISSFAKGSFSPPRNVRARGGHG